MNILLTLQKKLKKNTMSTFCENTSFVDRKKQSEEILKRYPNRVPIIVELSKHDHSLKPIDRTKYLVPDILLELFPEIFNQHTWLHILLELSPSILTPTSRNICIHE